MGRLDDPSLVFDFWLVILPFDILLLTLSPPPSNSLPPGEGGLFLNSLSLDGRG
jgi:hypothetical protein